MSRQIYLRYTLSEWLENECKDMPDEMVINGWGRSFEMIREILPKPTIKTCSCEAYKRIIAEKDAGIEGLRMGMDMIMRCAGAPDPAGALHTVIAIAKKAIAERSDK